MREAAAVNAAAWNHQALSAGNPDGQTVGRLELTQYPGHGPGIELLGDVKGLRVVELGCGRGHNLAALAAAGAYCVGVDIAAEQIRWARAAWPHINFYAADALDYLADAPPADLYLSIFGAVGLCEPGLLLRVLATTLHPQARLIFATPDPGWLADRSGWLSSPGGRQFPVRRWPLTLPQWLGQIEEAGLMACGHLVVDQPGTQQPCTMIVTVERRPAGGRPC
ncbi:hypothetical protein Lfu02_73270 [Longispora fulva]|uniref:SAM-dependent methyltransferase n=1 Tax=Longispora fulva TaxID=619741 RepID=A0A8J7G944_9ACTN|nr:class I SAM-dependent methyltransferase [Longispora fulva]MBG6133914.1 SAM-dependent methyltransferase [Longispora fulva]GIG62955.1 hypothetical protein Lfu02_73270 [Longispora fulva]